MSFFLARLARLSLSSTLLCVVTCTAASAAEVHGHVTDTLGAPVSGADLALVEGGKVVGTTRSLADGTYTVRTGDAGHFYVIVVSQTFRQVATPAFYAGVLDQHLQNVVLEPERVNQQVVVTATGTPTPQAQVSASITEVLQPEYRNRALLTDALRQAPGIFVVQEGQYGGITSLFVRGGNSTANRVVLDGVPTEDIGGTFDYSQLATTGIRSFEIYRGPNSTLYGSDAAAGVVNFETPRGTTAFPSLLYEGDAGNFHTYRNELQAGGTVRRLDYYGGVSALRSSNALPQDKYHLNSYAANIGYAVSSATVLRGTARFTDAAVGLPGAYDLFALTNDGKETDQNIYASGTLENQTTESWHNLLRYGLTRKREQSAQWYPAGIPITTDSGFGPTTNYYGLPVTIRGANGYSATGQAILNFAGNYPNRSDAASNRDQLYFQSDYRITPHLTGLIGFRYTNERGSFNFPDPNFPTNDQLERTNYDYIAQFAGDFKNRFFYTLSGNVEKNQLYGTVGQPRIGVAFFPIRPGAGIAHGTKLKFNFSKGVQEPDLFSQLGSLRATLAANGDTSIADQFHIRPIGGQQSRSYDGGVEQSLFNQRLLLTANYFHNSFSNQVEFVSPNDLLGLGVAQAVVDSLNQSFAFGTDVNSLSYRAQGAEVELQSQISRHLVARGGYTYTDAKVLRSFASDALRPAENPLLPGIPIGSSSPLIGARPFRRPPHVGFAGITYSSGKWFGQVQGAFASRSDDSTFLSGISLAGDDSLLLPNRNLDSAYAKIDVGGSYQLHSWISVYTELDNLVSDQHIGPIGFPSLPFTFRSGLRLAFGPGSSKK